MIKLGYAQADITPTEPMELVGFYRPDNVSKGVERPLLAQVSVWEDKERCCLITVDSLGFMKDMTDLLRERVGEVLGVSKDKVMVCFSHTHAAPNADSEKQYFEMICEKVLGAAQLTSVQEWVRASPSVRPQAVQVLGAEQVASAQLWPRASPSVSPHLLQVAGFTQSAAAHSWLHWQPARANRQTARIAIRERVLFMISSSVSFLPFEYNGSASIWQEKIPDFDRYQRTLTNVFHRDKLKLP